MFCGMKQNLFFLYYQLPVWFSLDVTALALFNPVLYIFNSVWLIYMWYVHIYLCNVIGILRNYQWNAFLTFWTRSLAFGLRTVRQQLSWHRQPVWESSRRTRKHLQSECQSNRSEPHASQQFEVGSIIILGILETETFLIPLVADYQLLSVCWSDVFTCSSRWYHDKVSIGNRAIFDNVVSTIGSVKIAILHWSRRWELQRIACG